MLLNQEFEPNDLSQRRILGEWALGNLTENPFFFFQKKIVFSDEAHFWFNGYVNMQNCQFWNKNQSEALQKLPMHPEKVTIWCGLWTDGIIEPHFLKGTMTRNVTVNGECYR